MKYHCSDIRQLLPVYVDNMTNQIETAMISEHLEECAECRREYEFLKSIIDTTRTLPSLEVSEDFSNKLHKKLVEAKNEKRIKALSAFKKTATIAVSSAAVIAISVVSLNVLNDKDMIASPPENAITSSPHEINSETAEVGKIEEDISEATPVTADGQAENADKNHKSATPSPLSEETAKAASEDGSKNEHKPSTESASWDVNSQNTADKAAPAALTVSESAAFSGGGGGSASGGGSSASARTSSARATVPQKVKITVSVSVKDADSALAKQLLSGYTYQSGAYVLSASEYHRVGAKLSEMGASLTIAKEDKTSEYAALYAQLENASEDEAQLIQSKLNQIDSEISKTYIVFN